ncbi:glutamate formimidoyltransferase, partial [candidate division KSB1 bacterium]|nr:glutamate formimidoyltransferase [candidate division KSB1 bacterium]NIS27607.1 glutamate formimidoyltransferase [candidate division KSB1 bacterium]NIT74449.1 glutamate formimidoyltransferase [candidate division KSB1 bacterium]NIU28323.1 glutamate formimidoyltransferase [candidate division KSB1 bacterium]NIU93192.1 glutamate formimidoyltransferase [candidate division KSB1 bacterium]
MTKPIVECVPNFSEGRNKAIIDRIAAEISSVEEVRLLSVEMGASVNRTVMTFLGSPDQVKEAAFHAIRKAAELIDMRKQRGLHPRIGATDVCPLVPLRGIDMEECVALSRELGKRVGDELQIPVYLYERSAIRPERRNLADIRSGNYEELEKKLQNPDWMPDYGPTEFNPRTGATIIGARNMLIAFNINLNTKTVQYAMDIAFELREKGRSVRTGNTNPIYMRGKLVKYRPNYYPCGNCDFIGKSYED